MASVPWAYHCRLDVYRSPVPDWHMEERDDEFMYAGVQLRFWKLLKDSSAESLVAAGSRYCDICLEAVVTEEEEPVWKIASCLRGLGVPESCHVRVIAEVLQYVESEVIMGDCGCYPDTTVAVDIVEASVGAGEGDVHEALRRSTEEKRSLTEFDIEETAMRLMGMDIGGGESSRGTAAAESSDDIAEEVRRLRRSMAMKMGKYDQFRELAAATASSVEDEEPMEMDLTPCFQKVGI